jgi:peroxiredoxin Q/BCP
MHTPRVGDVAPDGTLVGPDGKAVPLSSFRGTPLAIFFYPGDFTPGCAIQLLGASKDRDAFTAAGIATIGANPGPNERHDAFGTMLGLCFPLYADPNAALAKAFGATRNLLGKTLVRRTVVGLSADGRIAFLKTGFPKTADIVKALGGKPKTRH